MAKTSKQVADFQQALLSNTKVIGDNEGKKKSIQTTKKAKDTGQIEIEKAIQDKFAALAKRHEFEMNELANLALEHFIQIENIVFPSTDK